MIASLFSSADAPGAGEQIAQLLYRCWRPERAAPSLAERQLQALTPLLLNKGAGALAYRQLARSTAATSQQLQPLRDAFRVHVVKAALLEQRLGQLLAQLETARIPVLVVKGLAIARLYPETGLRPYGDHDLLVPPDAFAAAARVVARTLGSAHQLVDLHDGLLDLPGRSFAALWEQARVVARPQFALRTLGALDTLTLACMHMLRHGVERPLWLCDIALLLEQPDFPDDWSRALTPMQARWVGHALRLAGVLGARSPHCGSGAHPRLQAAVLREWSRPRITSNSLARDYLRTPALWPQLLRERWPNPICTWLEADLEPDRSPLPRQASSYGRQLLRFAHRDLRARPHVAPSPPV